MPISSEYSLSGSFTKTLYAPLLPLWSRYFFTSFAYGIFPKLVFRAAGSKAPVLTVTKGLRWTPLPVIWELYCPYCPHTLRFVMVVGLSVAVLLFFPLQIFAHTAFTNIRTHCIYKDSHTLHLQLRNRLLWNSDPNLFYFIIPSQPYMFRAMFFPIIRSTWLYLRYLVVFTNVADGWCLGWVGTHPRNQPVTTCVNTTRYCKYS